MGVRTNSSPKDSYELLKTRLRETNALQEINGILGYDEQVFMPPGAAAARAEQKATLAKLIHEKSTGDEMRAAIEGVRGIEVRLGIKHLAKPPGIALP